MIDIFLGILQGITEFLPISSSGHLVVFSSLFKENNFSTNEIAFLHLGTVLSILFFYYKDLIKLIKNKSSLLKIIKLLIVGMIPAAFVGLVLPISQLIDESKYILLITGFAYISFAVIMYYSEKSGDGETIIENISIKEAFTIGVAQGFALLPGVSRSGITLITAMFLKIKKTDAIFFSLLLGIPTIFGAWLITLLQSSEGINSNLVIPTLFAFVAGTITIKILINFTVNSKLKIFSYYCFAMGIISCGAFLINL